MNPPTVSRAPKFDISREISDRSVVKSNLGGNILLIEESKLRLALMKRDQFTSNKREWHVPVSILIGLLPCLASADFKDFLGLEKAVWKAAFILLAIANVVWLVRAVVLLFVHRGKGTIESLLEEINRAPAATSSAAASSAAASSAAPPTNPV